MSRASPNKTFGQKMEELLHLPEHSFPPLVLLALVLSSMCMWLWWGAINPPSPAIRWDAIPSAIHHVEGKWQGKPSDLGYRVELPDRILVTDERSAQPPNMLREGLDQRSLMLSEHFASLCRQAMRRQQTMNFSASQLMNGSEPLLIEGKNVYLVHSVTVDEETLRFRSN